MSDTRQRSAAEIMGWENNPEWGWYPPGSSEPYMPEGPQADDMISWLRGQGWSVYTGHAEGSGCSSVDLYRGGDAGPGQLAPTLHAALDLAVCAVAAADGTP